MDFEKAKQDILEWVESFVERPNANLNGWPPCPHARRARLSGQFEIKPGRVDPYTDLRSADMGHHLVIAYVYDPTKFTAGEFNQQIQAVNKAFLIPKNLFALADHPDDVENVKGVIMNQGQWAIAFLQHLSKLNQFARDIAVRGYYQDWPEHYLQRLFEDRQDPRQ